MTKNKNDVYLALIMQSFEAPQALLNLYGKGTFTKDGQVSQTSSGDRMRNPHIEFYPSRFGDNFGVGDLVLYNPKWEHPRFRKPEKEGIALEIYQYGVCGRRAFVSLVDFRDSIIFVPPQLLTPMTNNHVVFDNYHRDRFPKMENVPFEDFDKASAATKEIFEDPIARAVWMAYRIAHCIDNMYLEVLKNSARSISAELRQHPIPRERVGLWFRRNMRPRVDERFALNMVPYLLGEKEATYIPA